MSKNKGETSGPGHYCPSILAAAAKVCILIRWWVYAVTTVLSFSWLYERWVRSLARSDTYNFSLLFLFFSGDTKDLVRSKPFLSRLLTSTLKTNGCTPCYARSEICWCLRVLCLHVPSVEAVCPSYTMQQQGPAEGLTFLPVSGKGRGHWSFQFYLFIFNWDIMDRKHCVGLRHTLVDLIHFCISS